MIDYREILRLHSLGTSRRSIAQQVQSSRDTVASTITVAKAAGISWPLDDDVTNQELQELLFPGKYALASPYTIPDYEWIHRELAKNGVTLTLLWGEYCTKVRNEGGVPYMYTQFGDKYRRWARITKATMRCKRQALFYTVRWLLDWRDDSIENGRDDIPYYYYCKTSTRLTYKSGNMYSFRTEERWYGGGVLNISRSGINYNKKTGKYPPVSDFVAGNVNEKLVKKLKAVYPELATAKNIKYIRNKKKFSYYLQNGKAVVCFQPDALDQGLSYLSLGLKMK